MKKLFSIVMLLLLMGITFASCTSPTSSAELNTNSLDISVVNSQLKIHNNSDRTAYLFVVERGYAAAINWAIHFGEPNISANGVKYIDLSKIASGQNNVKPGDEVIVYFWDDTNKSNTEVFNKIVKL